MQLRVSSCLVFCQRIFPRGFLSYLVKEKFFLLLYSGVLFIQLFCACQIHMWSRLHIQSYHYSNGWHIFRLNGPCSVLQSIATLTVWVTKTRNTWKRKFWTDIWYENLKASTVVKKSSAHSSETSTFWIRDVSWTEYIKNIDFIA